MNWIHWIGTKYYSETSFVREALTFGITRRIDRRVLAKMNFGDAVYLAIKDGKSGVVFGKFLVNTISGMSAEETALLVNEYDLVEVPNAGPATVERGCGSYSVGGSYALVGDDRPTIAEVLAKIDPATDKGKLMVCGRFVPLSTMFNFVARVRVKSMPFAQGFRHFDGDAFIAAVEARPQPRNPSVAVPVRGHFYVGKDAKPSNVVRLDEYRVQHVTGYRRK